MASGVGLSDECLSVFQELKTGKKLKYIVYGLNPQNTEIIVLGSSDSTDYDKFVEEQLPKDQCRWAVYDFAYENDEGGHRQKLVFYSWAPNDAKIKQKMVFASSKDALRRSLVGIAAEIQGTDFDEVSNETVLDKVKRLR